jgi:uncharacterized membrane protein YhaH (DUF805 family)
MTLTQIIINLILAFLAFFVTRYVGNMVAPEGQDKDKIVTIVALLLAIVTFFANFAVRIQS